MTAPFIALALAVNSACIGMLYKRLTPRALTTLMAGLNSSFILAYLFLK